MSEKVGLLIDLGNSETRLTVVRNKVMTDFELSNSWVLLSKDYVVPKEYHNGKTFCVNFDDKKDGMEKVYANGELVQREFSRTAVKPNANANKTTQLYTQLSMNLIFLKTLLFIAESDNTTVDNVDVEFDIRIMLPPLEHDKFSDELKAKISSISEIDVRLPFAFKKAIKISSIVVLPEGATAYIGCMYHVVNNTLQPVPENTTFLTGDILVLDIGAGTTDIVTIRDTELIINSKETFSKGGNNVAAACKKAILEKYHYFPKDEDMQMIFEKGVYPKGATFKDATEELTKAKQDLGVEIKNFLIDYLARNDVEVHSLKGLLVVGGGTLPTMRDGKVVSEPMANILIEYVKELNADVSLVSTGGVNPRYLNRQGLKLYYQFI